jgi:hypothetical protein
VVYLVITTRTPRRQEVTEKQLKLRARRVQDAEAKAEQARIWRDAGIIQAVLEGRTKAEVAGIVGLTKARVGRIVADGVAGR